MDNGSNPTHLDHAPGKDCRNASCHTIFGHVVGGMMHVDAISQVPTISPYSTPVDAVLILGFTALTMDSVEAEQPVDLAVTAFTDLRLEQVLRQSNATIATMNFTLNNSGAWVGNVSMRPPMAAKPSPMWMAISWWTHRASSRWRDGG